MHIKKYRRRGNLKEHPAIVLTAFGTAQRGKAVYELFDNLVHNELKDYDISWAYTSEIIREKTGHPGILQTLTSLEQQGFTRVVVQPLLIFPGTEYEVLVDSCRSFPGLKVLVGETLLHRWHFVEEVLDIVSKDFIPPEKGINLLVSHGTPLCDDSANIVYLGLDHLLSRRYSNVSFCSVEGIPDREGVLRKLQATLSSYHPGKTGLRARIIPFMYVAGLHVEQDLLGKQDSYKSRLEEIGFTVECLTIRHQGEQFYKGLGFYEEIRESFLDRLRRSLDLIRFC
ncbi:MAG: sirohydrochlorin cobaltochelatase [Deltaproteobacteria bacterium]|nr:sirohydrochlorin cobaltochelatase [Deltaproteobacteria bacterium]